MELRTVQKGHNSTMATRRNSAFNFTRSTFSFGITMSLSWSGLFWGQFAPSAYYNNRPLQNCSLLGPYSLTTGWIYSEASSFLGLGCSLLRYVSAFPTSAVLAASRKMASTSRGDQYQASVSLSLKPILFFFCRL